MPTSLETLYSEATAPVAEEKIEEPKAAVNVTKPSEAATGSLETGQYIVLTRCVLGGTHFFLKGQF